MAHVGVPNCGIYIPASVNRIKVRIQYTYANIYNTCTRVYAGSEAHSHQEEKLTACENHYGIHSSGGLSSQKEYSLQRKSSGSTKETNQQDNNSGQGAQYSLKLGVGGVRSFFPSVYFLHICIGSLDVLHILYWMS